MAVVLSEKRGFLDMNNATQHSCCDPQTLKQEM
jgi:hypothetical protein